MSDLLAINVNSHTEKKNGLTYLSWAWAWAEVLKIDPEAEWDAAEYKTPEGTIPYMILPDGTGMVKVSVTINGKAKRCLLPVMDNRNKAIVGPNAFQVNTATMRCLAKAISMHGLGLYIYAGEDLPEEEQGAAKPTTPVIGAAQGIGDDLPEDWKIYLRDTMAPDITEMVNLGNVIGARERIAAEKLEADQHAFMFRHLSSTVRSALKAKP